MRILWTDQAEYYFVCEDCYYTFSGEQWSGSTHSYGNWRARAQQELKEHEQSGKECEFCGPHGNGGWSINGHFPAAEKRDARKKGGQP